MLIATAYNHSSLTVNNFSSLTSLRGAFMFNPMRYGERLQKARTHAGLTQRQLAERIGNVCTQENISKLERGQASGSEFTAQFANACGVRAMWLAAEAGEMLPDTYSTSDPTLGSILQVLEPQAEYVKTTAHKDVLSLIELAEHASAAEQAGKQETPPRRRTVNLREREKAMDNHPNKVLHEKGKNHG